MKIRVPILILLAVLVGINLNSTEHSDNGDQWVGYYRFDKHLPRKGCAIYFSWNSEFMPTRERIGVLKEGYIICDDYSQPDGINSLSARRPFKILLDSNIRLWRYVAPSYLSFDRPPFDEWVLYHQTDKNPPKPGQHCYFIACIGEPKIFAWEAISYEHYGEYIEGNFYKRDEFPILEGWRFYPSPWEKLPWPKNEKAPGVIYWREVPSETIE